MTIVHAVDLRVLPDAEALGAAVARAAADVLTGSVRARGCASIALAGGATPRALYEQLARDGRDEVPWAHVRFFWGDERYVPPDDVRSNYRMAREALLDRLPITAEQVYRMPTEAADPDEAAAAYERTLRRHFTSAWPQFDLVLLGLGTDGHTASIFPATPVVGELERWVAVSRGPTAPRVRLTLTLPALTNARVLFVVVSGGSKARILRRALLEPPDPRRVPATGIRLAGGEVVWWADAPAAALVRPAAAARATASGIGTER